MARLINQNGNFLLDTNIVIEMFSGNRAIQEKMQNSYNVFLASPVIGELYYGARKSDRILENLRRINSFVDEHIFLACDLETADWSGIIKARLQQKGRLISDNDIWIAAIAMQHGLILVTRDSHFDEIESLQVESW